MLHVHVHVGPNDEDRTSFYSPSKYFILPLMPTELRAVFA